MRHRHYAPDLGRWLSRDPLGYVHGMSLYEYVRGSPISYYDPSGLGINREWPTWLPRDISEEEIERRLKTATGKEAEDLRKAKKLKQEMKRIRDQQRNKGRQNRRGGRRGIVDPKVLGKTLGLGCLAACTMAYKNCLDNADLDHEECIERAGGIRCRELQNEYIDLCNSEHLYTSLGCATTYAACSLACVLPWSW